MHHYLPFFCTLLTLTALAQPAPKGIKIVGGTAPAGTERRIALVIGNKDYQHVRKLQNPLNDAADMSRALETLGFEVITATNTNYPQLINAINRFKDKLTTSDVALLYYSGHGVSYGGKNYLLPVDAELSCLEQIEEAGVSLNRVLADLAARRVKNSFVFLDACRNLPDMQVCDKTTKDLTGGAGLVKPSNNPSGSMVVFATREGSTADDNVGGRNGLFTEALLEYLVRPNWGIRSMLDQTGKQVVNKSGGLQRPGRYDELEGDFVFVQTVSLAPAPATPVREEPKPAPPRPAPARDLPVGPAMVYVPGGTFQMGSNESEDEKPIHTVTVSGFMMAKYEVTVGEFEQFVNATNHKTDAETGDGSYVIKSDGKWEKKAGVNWVCDAEGNPRDRSGYNHPVIHVSHNDAVAYCNWLTKRTGKVYRLPTEAEWEYAAGGGSAHTKYSWGDGDASGREGGNFADQRTVGLFSWASASYDDGYKYTAPVGSYAPNRLGLYDLSGNVWEWCGDWYDKDYYASSSTTNPTGSGTTGTSRVLRGGSWNYTPPYCRVADRNYFTPSDRNFNVGFRPVSQF